MVEESKPKGSERGVLSNLGIFIEVLKNILSKLDYICNVLDELLSESRSAKRK